MPASAGLDHPSARRAVRLALAMAIALTVAEARDQPFSFLTAMFAVPMLVNSPRPPRLAQGLAFAVIMASASAIALFLSGLLLDRPIAYLLLLGLFFVFCFHLQARGIGGPIPQLLLICNAIMPVIAVQSDDLALDLANVLVNASVTAPLVVWLAYALLPPCHADEIGTPVAGAGETTRDGPLTAALILILAFAFAMANADEASLVTLVTIIGILGQARVARGRAIGGLLLGNLVGGVAACLAFAVVTLLPVLPMLFLVVLLAGLILGGALFGPSPLAPVFGVAISTFLILFGLGLAPIGDDTGAAFLARVIDVALASAYAVGAIALFAGARQAMPQPTA